jgi:hypothetical protein
MGFIVDIKATGLPRRCAPRNDGGGLSSRAKRGSEILGLSSRAKRGDPVGFKAIALLPNSVSRVRQIIPFCPSWLSKFLV